MAGQPITPFKLERFFAKHEFTAPHLLCCSDPSPLSMAEILSMADPPLRSMWEELSLGYTESQGMPALRDEIVKIYTKAKRGDVVVLAPEEGIYLSMRTILSPGDKVVVQSPGYQSLSELALSIGCEVVRWWPDETTLKHDVAALSQLVTAGTKAVVINFPHNPTGGLCTSGELDEIVAMSQQAGAFLFSDEMYRGLEHDETKRLPCASDLYDKAISLCGLSKSYALPGLRIGWIYTRHAPTMSRILELKDYTTICCSAPSEVLGLIALRSSGRILLRNREIINCNKELFRDFFAKRPHLFEWVEPMAGSTAMVRLSDEVLGGGTSIEYCEKLVESHGVLLLPSCQLDYGTKHIRVGLGREDVGHILTLWGESLWETELASPTGSIAKSNSLRGRSALSEAGAKASP